MACCCRGKVGSTEGQDSMNQKNANTDPNLQQICKMIDRTFYKHDKDEKKTYDHDDCKVFFAKICADIKKNSDNLVGEILENYPINDDNEEDVLPEDNTDGKDKQKASSETRKYEDETRKHENETRKHVEELSQQPKRGQSQQPKQKLNQQPKRGQSQQPKQKLNQQPKRGQSQQPKQKQSHQPKQEQSQQPKQEQRQQPKQGQSQQPKQGQSQQPKQGQSQQPKQEQRQQPKQGQNEKNANIISPFPDALQLQTRLVYKLVGNYFDIPGVTKSAEVKMHHFFIWSLLAEGSTVGKDDEKDETDKKSTEMITRSQAKTSIKPQKTETPPSIAMEIFEKYEDWEDKTENKAGEAEGNTKTKAKNKIFAALFAAALLKAMSKESSDEKTELLESSNAFSEKAIDEIKKMYRNDGERYSRTYIARTKWRNPITKGRMTILDFAVKSKNLDFLNQPVCTTVLNERWMGNIAGKNTIKWLLFCLFLVPIFSPIWLVRYRPKSWEVQAYMDTNHLNIKMQANKDKRYQELENKFLTKWRGHHTFKRFQFFFEAPVIRFLLNGITYVFFLGYFSSVLLIQYSFEPTNDDLILLIFSGVIVAEEILPRMKNMITDCLNQDENWKEPEVECSFSLRMHVRSKRITSWLSSPSGIWNTLNIVSTILFIVGYTLKLIDIEASRIVMAVDLILLYIRSLQVFAIHKRLGPKILMIGHMFKDLFYFILILMVFVVSYGMASHSLMYPNSQLNTQFVLNLLKRAYWNIYGELLIEELEQKEPDCTFDANLYNNDVLPRCPTAFSTVWIPVLMGFYIMVANILLLNLLIAMFSSTYNKIEENSEKLWNYHRIYLIKRYEKQTWFILPLSTFYYFWYILTACFFKKKKEITDTNKEKESENKR